MFEIYRPIIKKSGFNPSPFAGNVPYYADSSTNPKCIGTPAWESFWDEIIYYNVNGYDTGGLHIPGEYFEYLNFKIIDGPSGPQYPDFIDLHYELYNVCEEIKYDPKQLGGIFPKARRKGLSFFMQQKVSYGQRYTERYRAAIAAGLQTFVDGFRSKLYRTYNEVPPELRMNHLVRNTESIVLGYEEHTKAGSKRNEVATVLFKTMKDSGSKLEGEYFNDVILEELGEFELAEKAIISITPALMDGDEYKGKIWGIGTGGSMQRGGLTFQKIVAKADSFGFQVGFIPGRRMYFPYLVRNGRKVTTPYLDKQYPGLSKKDELLGCEDIQAAQTSLTERKKMLAKTGDRSNLVQHNQNFPDKMEDVFISSGSNNFNTEKLIMQNFNIESQMRKYGEYILDFVKNPKGELLMPYKVIARVPKKSDPEWTRVRILHGHMPKEHSRDLDIQGVDGYNLDESSTSKSLGGIIVIRRNDMFPDDKTIHFPGKVPILVYYGRPPRKEMFWEISLKVSIFYNTLKNCMGGIDADSIVGYYKQMGCKKYLSPRPRSFESDNSEQKHEFWYKNTTYSSPRMISAMQSCVEDNAQYFWFGDLCIDLVSYDELNIGTDYDLADALGHALIRIQDMTRKPKMVEEPGVMKIHDMPVWKEDNEGNLISDQTSGNQDPKMKVLKEEQGGWSRL